MEDGKECILPGWRFSERKSCFFRITGEALREFVTLVTGLKLLIVSEAHSFKILSNILTSIFEFIRLCLVEHTHEHTLCNLNIFLYHFHQQLNYIVFEV